MSDLPVNFLAPPCNANRLAATILAPPPAIDLNAWANEHLVLGSESPFPGRYNPQRCPYFHQILDVCGPEHATRMIVLKGSAQIGKTLLAQIFVAASLDLD